MSIRELRRESAIDRMADHVLEQGLAGASLRPLAAAAGTSDRMLLYYFADKDEVLTATLERIALRLTDRLNRALSSPDLRPAPILLNELWAALASAEIAPFMHLWLDLVAGSARGLEPHRTVAGRIAEGFLSWIGVRLDVSDAERQRSSATLLVIIEGALVLQAVGRRSAANEVICSFSSSH